MTVPLGPCINAASPSEEPAGDPVRMVSGGVVLRRDLFDRLSRAGRVTEVSGPAGSGKSVLLRSWIDAAALTEQAAQVSAQDADRDPRRFWISVADALRGTAAGSALIRPLAAAPDLDGWSVVERLLADLRSLPDRIWLVIDDVHALGSAEALRQLELLLTRAPAGGAVPDRAPRSGTARGRVQRQRTHGGRISARRGPRTAGRRGATAAVADLGARAGEWPAG